MRVIYTTYYLELNHQIEIISDLMDKDNYGLQKL